MKRSITTTALLLLAFSISLPIFAYRSRVNFKTLVLDYNSPSDFSVFGDTSILIKIINIDPVIDKVQVHIQKSEGSIVIGRRNKAVEREVNGSTVDFKIKVSDRADLETVKFKTFRKTTNGYKIVDKQLESHINVRHCPKSFDPVCGQPPIVECPVDQIDCVEFLPEPVSYRNECLMDKAGSILIYEGECAQ